MSWMTPTYWAFFIGYLTVFTLQWVFICRGYRLTTICYF